MSGGACDVGPAGAAAGAPLRVAFELTDEDLRTVYERYYKAAYGVDGRKQPPMRRVAMWIGAAGCAAGLFGSLIARSEGADIPILVIVLLFIGACSLLGSLADNRRERRRNAARALDGTLKSCVLDTLIGGWAVELTTEGVRADYAAETRLIKWAGVWGFQCEGGFASITGIDSRSIIIPLRAFDEPREESARAFIAAGESLLAASGHGFRARIAEHLATHDVPCPRCRYNLRGSMGEAAAAVQRTSQSAPRCPECGWLLTPANVPEAFGRRDAHA